MGHLRPGDQLRASIRHGQHDPKPVSIADPYNLYFTPDGRYAIVVAEQRSGLTFATQKRWRS